MHTTGLVVGGLLILLIVAAGVRSVHPDRVVNADQRDFLIRAHRAMHRRPVLLFAVPLAVVLSGVAEQLVGVLRGAKPVGELVLVVAGLGSVVIIVRLWRWRREPSIR